MSSFIHLDQFVSKMPMNSKFAVLKLVFDDNIITDNIKTLYKYHIEKHNADIISSRFPNSGFDLLISNDIEFQTHFNTTFIDHGVKADMSYYDPVLKTFEPAAFNMVPRSSISKTPLMMSNHVGIIDSGYRGNLLAAVRYLPGHSETVYRLESKTRLFQVCHPSLCPIFVVVSSESDLSITSRGAGGFGSTGV